MRKILMLSVFAAVAFTACKKQEDTVSKLVTVSYPTVIIKSPQYYSFPVGGGPLPSANNIVATAYDSFYHEKLQPVVDASKLSSLTSGLYVATVSAKNSYGYVGNGYVYVGITDIHDSINISGVYVRRLSPSDSAIVHIMKLAAGLYMSDNIAGVSSTNPGFIIPGVFVMDGDGSTLHMDKQPSTTLGTFEGANGLYDNSTTDTTISYNVINNANFGGQSRIFHKMQ
jgi:hypothetical protein